MGLDAAVLAAISAGTTAVGTAYSITQNQRARSEQKKIQGVQNAANQTAQMEERRQQIREERIRRARIMQAGENTGTSGSAGEAGSIGSLSTQLSSNIASNSGKVLGAQAISGYQQNIANAQNNVQVSNFLTGMVGMGVDMSGSIFGKQPDVLGDFIKDNNLQNK